jgi:PAS domain S-box-containing protein
MRKAKSISAKNNGLKRRAEKLLSQKGKDIQKMSTEDGEKLVHELQVHQIELEMQNEELRKAQVEIEHSRSKYSDLYDFAPVGYFTFDQKGMIVEANLTGAQLLGMERSFLINKPFNLFVEPEFQDIFLLHRRKARRKGIGETCELKLKREKGFPFYALLKTLPVEDGEGNWTQYRTAITDITERKLAEEALWRSQQLFADIFRVSPAATILSSLGDGRCVDANEAYARLTGYTREELIGKITVEMNIWLSAEERQRVVTELAQKGHLENVELTLRRKNGEFINTLSAGEVITLDGQRFILSFFFDITQRQRMEEELRRSRDELELRVRERTAEVYRQAELLDLAHDAIVVREMDGVITFWNEGATEMYGWGKEEALGKIIRDLLETEFPMSRDEIMTKVVQEGRWEGELTHTRKGGKKINVLSRWALQKDEEGRPTGIMLINHDITRRLKLEEQLRQAQKMEAIGTLTGGIAHDFNNILAVIVINSDLALFDLSGESGIRNNLEVISKSARRGVDLVRQMLLFSRKSEKKQEILTLTPLIKETFRLLRSSIPTTIQMKLHLETESDAVNADPSQIQQVILNLCTNAAYAMRGTTGSIDISLQGITFGSTDLPEADMHPGDYLVLSVKDTGSGMDEEVRNRIFEPFFTTKPVGEGTGLGLSVVYGIVKSHRGGITVYSEPGKGSVFKVYLPKVDTDVSVEAEIPKPIPRGNERILLLDDEEIVVNSVQNMLQHIGYKVTALTDSQAALKLFSANPSEFDLVMTDQTMPFMTGEDLSKELIRIRPDIPMILCTGYSDLISSEKATAMGFRGFILKPFNVREGAELVRSVLDQKGPK